MRTKRFLAVLLATTMVLGSAVTAFATDPTTSASGTGDAVVGQGAAEGYVDTSVTKVVLPTTTATTFAFIMDPQEMLKTTDGARLGTAWTQPENDTFVYFKTASGYANESDTVFFINKSTVTDLDVTVKAVVEDASTKAIALDTKANAAHGAAALADDADAKLYLGLKVGGVTTALASGATGTTTVVAADKAPNEYTIVYDTKAKAYKYAEKAGSTFQAVPISVEGSVSHKATDENAPKLTLTWSWATKGNSQTTDSASVKYVTTDAYTVANAKLDQTAAAYGSFYGKVGPGYGGKLTISGTASATITFADEVDKVEFSATPSNATSYAANTALVTAKGKVVTIKGSVWNATGANAISSGSKIKVTFKDPDGDGALTAPTEIYFEK